MTEAWRRPILPIHQPVEVVIEFIFKAQRKADLGSFRPLKPDVDNLGKLVLDAAIGIIFEDDHQVVTLHMTKRWGVEACTRIFVRGLPI